MFDIVNLINIEIEKEIYGILQNKAYEKISEETLEKFDLMRKSGYFFYDPNSVVFEDSMEGKEVTFTLTPIFECNLQCKYCFADAGKKYQGPNRQYDEKVLNGIAEYMIKNFNKTNRFRLSFVSGGEPFLDFDLLLYIVNFYSAFFENHGKEIKIWVCTNGTLINENYIKRLDSYNIQLGISQDGNKRSHDLCRIDKKGKGTYDTIQENVAGILANNMLSQRVKKIWGSAVITAGGDGFLPTILEHKKLGFKNSQLRLVQIPKESYLAIHSENLDTIYKWIDELFKYLEAELSEGKIDTICMILNENDYIGKILRRLIIHKNYIYRCQAGRLHRSFTPEGDIYPCDSFIGMEQFKLGNIFTGENNLFNNKSVLERDNCKDCWARFVCGGDCYFNSYCCNENPYIPDDIYCHIIKYTVKESLFMLNNVQKRNKNVLNELSKIQKIRDNVLYQ